MLNLRYTTILFLLVLTFTSCFRYTSYLPKTVDEVNLDLPIQVDNIVFIDTRDSISEEEDIKLPFMSKPKMLRIHKPQLTEHYKSIIQKTIHQNLSTSDSLMTSTLTIIINEALKKFTTTWKSEKEIVILDITIDCVDKISGNVYQGAASEEFYYDSMDASNKHFEKLFQSSLSNITFQALYNLRFNLLNNITAKN